MIQSQPGAAARGLATDIYLLEARARRRLDGTVPTQAAHSKATLVTRSESHSRDRNELQSGVQRRLGLTKSASGRGPNVANETRAERNAGFSGVTRPTRKTSAK